eukprot:Hpha_TRINITY_DN33770_c0_g1::TRINITY_DN33770_c0_g1_i1::g.24972::m.24972/K03648/UNG, UDG; uracil-DNA glycosylase
MPTPAAMTDSLKRKRSAGSAVPQVSAKRRRVAFRAKTGTPTGSFSTPVTPTSPADATVPLKQTKSNGSAVARAGSFSATSDPTTPLRRSKSSGGSSLLRRLSTMPCPDPVPTTPASRELAERLVCREWQAALQAEFEKQYFVSLADDLAADRARGAVFPPSGCEFVALNATPLSSVRVVIIGQDPYPNPRQAHGMCFSVPFGVQPPRSLCNIFTELEADLVAEGWRPPGHGYLKGWADQGVLLLNASLTVKAHEPLSHSRLGWEYFTDAVIRALDNRVDRAVFLLWGQFAQKKCRFIDREKHSVIECAHPSPLSVTKWKGNRCFSQCNRELEQIGKGKVKWELPPAPEVIEMN